MSTYRLPKRLKTLSNILERLDTMLEGVNCGLTDEG